MKSNSKGKGEDSRETQGTQDTHKALPAFQRIKDYLLGEIQAWHWKEGEAIPPESALAKQFGVSRMTVNRAVRELTAEQILMRVQGSGTYVAQHKYQATLVEIKSIADGVRGRGHIHRSELLKRRTLSQGQVASVVTMWHSGSRYQFAGSF